MSSQNYFNSEKQVNEGGNRNHLTSVGYEAVIFYQFGKAPYILTENLFAGEKP
jgi:hypothetical protein